MFLIRNIHLTLNNKNIASISIFLFIMKYLSELYISHVNLIGFYEKCNNIYRYILRIKLETLLRDKM